MHLVKADHPNVDPWFPASERDRQFHRSVVVRQNRRDALRGLENDEAEAPGLAGHLVRHDNLTWLLLTPLQKV